MPSLQHFKDALERSIYGETPAGHCVACKQAFSVSNTHTEAGWRETKLSKMCENCFDKLFGDE